MLWFLIPAVFSLLSGFILFYRFPRLKSKQGKIKAEVKISIIIPARNEEKNLPLILDSIKSQTFSPHEIIVVNDSSTDKTVETAQSYGAKIIDSGRLLDGWLGKPWSCYRGALKSRGDILIFLDADTVLEPDALLKIVHNFTRNAGVLSIFPYHSIKKFHEAFSAIFNLMQLAGMYKNPLLKKPEPAGMFGPCLVISRSDYFRIGGHEAVRGEVLEHYIMARVLNSCNIHVRLYSGKGTLNVRMYPEGWKALVSGWSKSITRGADLTPGISMSLCTIWISGLTVSSILFCYSIFSADLCNILIWSMVYLVYAIELIILFKTAGNFPIWSAVLYPVNLLFFLAVFSMASYRISKNRQAEWKGRKIS